jgi:hypothetical protein
MKAISGMKAGMRQGELGGALKEAGFTEEQVSILFNAMLCRARSESRD